MISFIHQPAILTVARILFVALFFQDAIFNKIMHAEKSMALMASMNLPFRKVLLVLLVAFELIGGLMLIMNWYTSIVVLFFGLFCFTVSFLFHPFWQYKNLADMQNQMNHFMKNMAISGGAIYIAAYSLLSS
jgi:putative oxidoreductase